MITGSIPSRHEINNVGLVSAGMGAGTFHGCSVSATFSDVLSSYNETTASLVDINRSQVKVNSVLSLEWMVTSCVVGK